MPFFNMAPAPMLLAIKNFAKSFMVHFCEILKLYLFYTLLYSFIFFVLIYDLNSSAI